MREREREKQAETSERLARSREIRWKRMAIVLAELQAGPRHGSAGIYVNYCQR